MNHSTEHIDPLVNLFTESVNRSIETDPDSENKTFSPSRFFDIWFHELGDVYYFLFKKNRRVTNIQFAELVSLIRLHTSGNLVDKNSLQMHTARDFKIAIKKLITEYRAYTKKAQEEIYHIYPHIIQNHIIVNPFYGSCSVFVPPNLKLDLAKICAESGYIHSCGRLVFVRNTNKLFEEEIFTKIDGHLRKYPVTEGTQALFIVYAHEDFSKSDRKVADDLRHGLDDVKIYLNKAYLQESSLIICLAKIKARYEGHFLVPDPGDYRIARKKLAKRMGNKTPRTFWLVSDSSAKMGAKYPGSEKYYICYDQLYYNANPFHLFDEDKPAWLSHTTIPHTLAGAMINVCRPWLDGRGPAVLRDPFGGTGTIHFEALKFADIKPVKSDLLNIFPMLFDDNVEFFEKSARELGGLVRRLKSLGNAIRKGENVRPKFVKKPVESKIATAYANIIELFEEEVSTDHGDLVVSSQGIERLKNKRFLERLLFYLATRAAVRHFPDFTRQADEWDSAFQHELKGIIDRIELLMELKQKQRKNKMTKSGIEVYKGDYSDNCYVDMFLNMRQDLFGVNSGSIFIGDAREIPPNSCSIIMTDPPYGFNTRDEEVELGKLYSQFISVFVRALRPNGQLVICCPEKSYSGRRLPFFTEPSFITQQVIAAAQQYGKSLYNPAYSLPSELKEVRPPYYWESEKALRRSILHFWIAPTE